MSYDVMRHKQLRNKHICVQTVLFYMTQDEGAEVCWKRTHTFLFSFACFFIIYSIIWNTCYTELYVYIYIFIIILIYHISIYSSTFCDRPFSRWWQEGWWWKLTLLWAIIGRPWQSLPRIWRTPFVGIFLYERWFFPLYVVWGRMVVASKLVKVMVTLNSKGVL